MFTKKSLLIHACIKYLQGSEKVLWAANLNNVHLKVVGLEQRRKDSSVRYVYISCPDIIGELSGGLVIAIFCQVRKANNELTPYQMKFLQRVKMGGGIAICAYDVSDIEMALKDIQACCFSTEPTPLVAATPAPLLPPSIPMPINPSILEVPVMYCGFKVLKRIDKNYSLIFSANSRVRNIHIGLVWNEELVNTILKQYMDRHPSLVSFMKRVYRNSFKNRTHIGEVIRELSFLK
jgi:hypothetical protein